MQTIRTYIAVLIHQTVVVEEHITTKTTSAEGWVSIQTTRTRKYTIFMTEIIN